MTWIQNNSVKNNGLAVTDPYAFGEVLLPSRLFATEGFELGVYFKSVLKTTPPLGWGDYFIAVNCTKGTLYQNKFAFKYTPIAADAGNYSCVVAGSINDTAQVTKTSTIYVTAKAQSAVSRKMLCIGDSRTFAGVYVQRILANSAADGNLTITAVGTKGTAPNKHEGISGKTFYFFTQDPTSPFIFSGVFNFAQYLSINSISLSATDTVFISLDVNDVNTSKTDAILTGVMDGMVTNLNTMLTSIQAAVPNIRIAIVIYGITAPSVTMLDAGAINWVTPERLRRNMNLWKKRIISTYDNSTYQAMNIDVVGNFASLDEDNDMNDSFHQTTAGYNKVGDVFWSYLKFKN